MLNRRHLRIKALQVLYSYFQSGDKDMRVFEKQLLSGIAEVNELYLKVLLLATEIINFEEVDLEERSNKLLPSKEDKNASAQLSINRTFSELTDNPGFKEEIKKYKISWNGEQAIIRELYNKFKKSKEYEEYIALTPKTPETDRKLILVLIKKFIAQSPILDQYFEEASLNWQLDKDTIISMSARTIKNIEERGAGAHIMVPLTVNWEDDREFVLELFRKSILNDELYQQYINSKIENWEPDRIALIDTILMKLAICEVLNFPSIPVKVTMNEYIDISKEFSTPKSKGFINGILDKLIIDFKEEGKIKKSGRGLLES